MFCVFFAKDDDAKTSKDFQWIHLLTLLFLFLGLFGERYRLSISWFMDFSCFHWLLNSICSSYWDPVLKSICWACLPTQGYCV